MMNDQEEFANRKDEILSQIPEEFRSYFFLKSWEQGHAYGYYEVLNCLDSQIDGFGEALEKYTTRILHTEPFKEY